MLHQIFCLLPLLASLASSEIVDDFLSATDKTECLVVSLEPNLDFAVPVINFEPGFAPRNADELAKELHSHATCAVAVLPEDFGPEDISYVLGVLNEFEKKEFLVVSDAEPNLRMNGNLTVTVKLSWLQRAKNSNGE